MSGLCRLPLTVILEPYMLTGLSLFTPPLQAHASNTSLAGLSIPRPLHPPSFLSPLKRQWDLPLHHQVLLGELLACGTRPPAVGPWQGVREDDLPRLYSKPLATALCRRGLRTGLLVSQTVLCSSGPP